MELDTLKQTWKSVDPSASLAETLPVFKPITPLWRLYVEPLFELFVAIIMLVSAGGFIGDHWIDVTCQPAGALPAAGVIGLSIATLRLSALRFQMIQRIDLTGPIASTATQVSQLETLVVRSTRNALLTGVAFWFVFPLFAGQVLLSYDIVNHVSMPYLLSNVLLGLLVVATVFVLDRRLPATARVRTWLRETLSGSAIHRAKSELAEVMAYTSSDR